MSTAFSKYALYIAAFQNPEADVSFLSKLFKRENCRKAKSLREDFCGTASICARWIESDLERMAIGVDIDEEPIAWGREHVLGKLEAMQRARVQLVCSDVFDFVSPLADVIVAFNCSFCVFKRRDQLKAYFECARNSLVDDGLLVLELYAGPEAQTTGVDRIQCTNFVAVWEQAEFNAVTNEALNRVHFEFTDGSRLQNAFVYDWRLWSPIELTDLLLECGFRDARLYRKQKTDDGETAIEPCTWADVPNYWEVYVVGFR
jgi:SAM-dependent methyltransferase